MSIDDTLTVENAAGAQIPVYARMSGGMIDLMIRADTRADFRQVAVATGLIEIVDGEVIVAPGVDLDPIGPIVKTPAVMSGMTVVTPAVMDNRWHCNMRISRAAVEREEDGTRPRWVKWITRWHKDGVADGVANKSEVGVKLLKITFIDPSTISTPKRVWL